MPMIDKVRVQLLFVESPWRWSDDLLSIFEQMPNMAPTYWGETDQLRNPYKREDLERFVRDEQRRAAPTVPSLRRTVPARYVATCDIGKQSPASLLVVSRMTLSPDDPASFFDLSGQLASRIPFEFGVVDLRFSEAPDDVSMNRGALQHPDGYVKRGPTTLFSRTLFGKRLVDLMGGVQVLQDSGGTVTGLASGGAMLDLVAEPWKADASSLKQKQVELLGKLRSTGIFARTEGTRARPGERWVPPPLIEGKS